MSKSNRGGVALNLEQLRKQAKELLGAVQSGDGSALSRVRQHLPRQVGDVQLADAQHVVAREAGYPSWPRLKQAIEAAGATASERAAELVAAAINNQPTRFKELLEANPGLGGHDLATACVTGDLSRMVLLLQRDGIGVQDKVGPAHLPPLLYVMRSCGHLEAQRRSALRACAEELLRRGASPNVRYPFDPPWQSSSGSPLYLAAAIWSDAAMTRMLLDAGAVVDAPEEDEALYHATEKRNTEVLTMLLERSQNLGWRSYCLLAMLDREWPEGVELFLQRGVDLTHRHPKSGETALHWAVKRGRSAAIVRRLLESGADPGLADYTGTTPYLLALRTAHAEAVRAMEERGYRPASLSPADQAFRAAASGEPMPTGPIAFEHAHGAALVLLVQHGKTEPVRRLLASGVVPLGLNEWGHTPLHWACVEGRPDMVRLLIEAGAPLNVEDPEHHATPAGWADWGSMNFASRPPADYAACLGHLLAAGARVPDRPCARPELEAVRQRYLSSQT